MDDLKSQDGVNRELESSLDSSAMDVSLNPDNSVNYQTADEDNSRYFSVIDDESTLEEINTKDLSLQNESEQSTLTIQCDDKSFDVDSKSMDSINNLSQITNVDKFHVHENIDSSANILSGCVDIFDDNESSVDGHDLVIDDDPQPSEKSDDCQELSADTQFKYEEENSQENNVITIKDSNFSMLKKNHFANELLELVENTNMSHGTNDSDSQTSSKVNIKDLFGETEEGDNKSYNFPEGSHTETLQINGNNVEAINIGQDVYIYTDSNGDLTACQVLKEDGSVKYLHVGRNEEGNIEVYEEQVQQVVVPKEEIQEAKNKSKSIKGADDKIVPLEQQRADVEKSPQNLIQTLITQEKKNISNNIMSINSSATMDSDMIKDDLNIVTIESKMDASSQKTIRNGEVAQMETGFVEVAKLDQDFVEDISKIDLKADDLLGSDDVKDDDNKITLYASQESDETVEKLVVLDAVSKVIEKDEETIQIALDTLVNIDAKTNDSSIDSDDEFFNVVEGEPVTGDCEINWVDKPSDDAAVLHNDEVKVECENVEMKTINDYKDIVQVIALDGDKILNEKVAEENIVKVTNDEKIVMIEEKIDDHKLENDLEKDKKGKVVAECIEEKKMEIVLVSKQEPVVEKMVNNVDNEPKKVDEPIKKNRDQSQLSLADVISKMKDELQVKPETKDLTVLPDIIKNNEMDLVIVEELPKNIKPHDSYSDLDIDNFNPVVNRSPYTLKTYSKESKLNNFNLKPKNESTPAKSKDSLDEKKVIISKDSPPEIDSTDSSPTKDSLPKNKNRQPRKQVFTPVCTSDIEIIFLKNAEEADKDVMKQKMNKKSHISESDSSEKVDESIANKASESPSENCIKENICNNSDTLKDQKVVESPSKPHPQKEMSSSEKRKRGRPRKIVSESENSCEVNIAIVETAKIPQIVDVIVPSSNDKKAEEISTKPIETIDIKTPTSEKTSEAEEKSDKNVIIPSDTGKRKKGRPKKILSASFNTIEHKEEKKVDNLRKSLPNLSEESRSEESDNVCPICSKNFRTKNVLLKHAKHCNGVIEVVKSPKRKRVVNGDEAKKEPSVIPQSEAVAVNVADLIVIECGDVPAKVDIQADVTKDDTLTLLFENVETKGDKKTDDSPLENKTNNNNSAIVIDDSVCESDGESTKATVGDSDEAHSFDSLSTNNAAETVSEIISGNVKKPVVKPSKIKQLKRGVMASPMSRLSKILKTKSSVKIIKCDICTKTFRQLAHKVDHMKKHEMKDKVEKKIEAVDKKEVSKVKEDTSKSVEGESMLKCEICKKGFRKLHHLVQHRVMHNSSENKSRRVSVNSVKSEPEAGFRCETCDKSFRKLHHLVQHRELHTPSVVNEPSTSAVVDDTKLMPIPEENTVCICGRSFRKRHHMVEHRDIHCSPSKIKKGNIGDNVRLSIASSTSNESNDCNICSKSGKLRKIVEHRINHNEVKLDVKSSVPDKLDTKDIIHECSKCYMVFPNINSLNKHMANCKNRKFVRRTIAGEGVDNKPVSHIPKRKSVESITKEVSNKSVVSKPESKSEVKSQAANNMSLRKSIKVPRKSTTKIPSAVKPKKPKLDSEQKSDAKSKVNEDDSSSDDDVRYQLNPDYKPVQPKTSPKAANISLSKKVKTVTEDSTVRYSFPKSPKIKNSKINKEQPSTSSATRSIRKTISPKKAVSKNVVVQKKKEVNKPVSLLVRRSSLGGRKSLDVKKLPVAKKIELRCCGKIFHSQAALTVHRKMHKEVNKVHQCDCGKKFVNPNLLNWHIETEHTPPKSFKCQICDSSFRTSAQYAKHKKTHEVVNVSGAPVAQSKARRSLKTEPEEKSKKPQTVVPTPSTNKRKAHAHGGVPLSENMKKAIANAKF